MDEKNLKEIAGILTAITALITAVLALWKVAAKLWNKILWPLVKVLTFLGTLFVPIGIIVWFFMNLAAENANRLDEQIVVFSFVGQATGAISIYALFWGMVLCPKLRFLLKWSNQQPTDGNKPEIGDNRSDEHQPEIIDTHPENGESAESCNQKGGAK